MNHFSTQKNLLCTALCASLLAGLSGCQDEDFGYTADQIKYEKNFIDVYGEIPADKNWDLSSDANWSDPTFSLTSTRGTHAIPTNTLTEGTHYKTVDATGTNCSDGYWQVPDKLFNWMKSHLIEGNDNQYLGSSFVLQMPDNDFAIIPIFQGNSAIMSKLEIKINDYQIKEIWTKSQNIQADDGDGKGWQDLGYFDGQGNWNSFVPGTTNYPYPKHPASVLKSNSVRSKPIVFNYNAISDNGTKEGLYMYLSLKNIAKLLQGEKADNMYDDNDDPVYLNTDGEAVIDKTDNVTFKTKEWDSDNTWTTKGDRLTSLHNGYMLALDVPWNIKLSPSELPTIQNVTDGPAEMLLIGCEDANGASSDHDINDIVFLIVGYPKVPSVVPTTKVIKKRYMCEDLGATNDFDFNDIVVDVTQEKDYEIITDVTISGDNFFFNDENRIQTPSTEITELRAMSGAEHTRQYAKIAHLCGTLPITAQVGNYTFPWINDPTDLDETRRELSALTRAKYDVLPEGWNPNQERTITGWNPETNNITILVKWPDNWKWKPKNNANPIENNPFPNNTQDFADFANGKIYAATFPDKGNVPYIIAVNQDVHWMKECENIPREWLTNGTFNPNYDGVAGVGSSAYIQNYGSSNEEALLWEGSLIGDANSTGVSFPVGSGVHNGILDVFKLGYNVINIYTDCSSSAKVTDGSVGLCSITGDGWMPLHENDADGYNISSVVVDGCRRTSIMLTWDQIQALSGSGDLHEGAVGLAVQSKTGQLRIKKITMTKGRGNYVTLTKSPKGRITASDHWRWNTNDEKGSVAFVQACYPIGSVVTFKAEPYRSYKFVKWTDDNSTEPSRTITINSGITLGAEYEFDPNPHIKFLNNKDQNISLMVGTSYEFEIESNNQNTKVENDANNSAFTITTYSAKIKVEANQEGDGTFKLWQESNVSYNKSDELTVNVHVLPAATISLKGGDKYHEWESEQGDVSLVDELFVKSGRWNGKFNQNVSDGAKVYGDEWSNYKVYSDLTSSKTLVVEVAKNSPSVPMLAFNEEYSDNGYSGNKIDVDPSDSPYFITTTKNNGNRCYIMDVQKFKEDKNLSYVHLNFVYAQWGKTTKVIDLLVDSHKCEAEKTPAQLALTDPSQATIVLDYAAPSVNIGWSKADGAGEVKFKGYDYATEVNIWRNGEQNSHHMRAQEKNFNNKKITMYVEATETHRSASIELDVTVKDYVDANFGYRVAASNNEVTANMIKDALHNTNKNIQVMVRRGTSVPTTIKVKNATGAWDKTLKENGDWTSGVSHNESWEGLDAISFTFTISASDFSTYFSEWNSKLIFYGFDSWNGINDGAENQRGVWVKAVD